LFCYVITCSKIFDNKLKYKGPGASYIGQTKRQLKTRVNKHAKNIKMKRSKHSIIINHILEKTTHLIGIKF